MTDSTGTKMFFGRIHPERAAINVLNLPTLSVGFSPDVLSKVRIEITVSQVTVRVEGSLHADPATERNAVAVVVQLLVDILGFSNGCGYTVEITGCSTEAGSTIFGVDIPALTEEPLPASLEFKSIAGLFWHDPEGKTRPLRRALADFRRAIQDPDDTAFHCYRAVEALSFYFDSNRAQGWAGLRSSLRLDEQWIKSVLKKPADEIRHGRVVAVSEGDRLRAFRAARLVITRFMMLLYLQVPILPAADYPEVRQE